MNYRELLKDKKRVVIKVGSSSLIHKETNKLDLRKPVSYTHLRAHETL